MRYQDFVEEQLATDPEFRAIWEAGRPLFEFQIGLVRARLAAGLTQAELAERIGSKQPTIARLESGDGWPALDISFIVTPDGFVLAEPKPGIAPASGSAEPLGELSLAMAGTESALSP